MTVKHNLYLIFLIFVRFGVFQNPNNCRTLIKILQKSKLELRTHNQNSFKELAFLKHAVVLGKNQQPLQKMWRTRQQELVFFLNYICSFTFVSNFKFLANPKQISEWMSGRSNPYTNLTSMKSPIIYGIEKRDFN